MLATVTLAVTTDELLIPKVTLFELEKTTVPLVAVCVPAAIAPGAVDCSALAEAVMVEPLRPKETLFEFENVMAERLFDVVPALTLMFVRLVATEAVIVEALSPKLTPFELEKVKALARLLVVPAERLIEPCVLATVTLAVTTDELLIPKVTLLEFEKTTVPEVAVCVPAAMAPGDVDCE